MQKNTFFEWNFIQKLLTSKIKKFKLMYIHIIHHKKIHPIIPSTTLVLKCIFKISNYVANIIFSQIYSIHSSFSMFVGLFKVIY
jgi:hypothetical protein